MNYHLIKPRSLSPLRLPPPDIEIDNLLGKDVVVTGAGTIAGICDSDF